jgi:eukaryotic-like serine/threonine-protein kinase
MLSSDRITAMPLAPGVRLGPYEVLGLIGAGGMGEVYRARDTRLERTVAVKILPPRLALDPARRARFQREAHAISALEHPHICTLHDIGEQEGQVFLVMEHLKGETLAGRLEKGPLPLAQALEVGVQIADALAAAHKQGIVHRDLKPGNVMLTGTGAKLLDFGLASLRGHGEQRAADSLTSTPTEAAPLTGEGTILGTMPYMAPEQLEGRAVDARTDVWALGAILYEMVTGRRAFEGRSSASLVAAILEREPAPLATTQPLAPPSLERTVKRCLAKSPDERWDGAHDVADELRWIAQGGPAPAGAPTVPPRRRWFWPLVAGGLALAAASGLAGALVGRRLPATPRARVVRSLLDVSPAEELNAGGRTTAWLPTPGGSRTALAWTPDGRSLVFAGRRGGVQRIYVRDLDGDQARPLEGTEGAQVPVVSPDGRSVAFWANGAIRRVPLAGGPAAVLVPDVPPVPTGMAWRGDGRLFYGAFDGGVFPPVIWSAEAERAPAAVTRRLDDEVSHVLPHLLPDGHALLYTVRRRVWTWGDEEVVAHVFATGERKALLRDAADARYVPSGHLVFLRRGVLHAVRFDAARLEVRGSPEPVLGGVAQALASALSGNVTGAGQFGVASTGALAFVPGDVPSERDTQLVAIDRQGRVSTLGAPARSYAPTLGLSRDGRHLAVVIRGLTEHPVWLFDRGRGTLTRLPGGGDRWYPRWTPDGSRVAFELLDKGIRHLTWQPADGTAAPDVLVRGGGLPSAWSPDGRQLAFFRNGDIWIATLDGGKAVAAPLATTPEAEQWPEFSPDGQWLASGSNASGRDEVYVQPYPGPGARQLVSLEGGTSPAWSPTGRELFFLSPPDREGRRRMMVADVRPGPTLGVGRPRLLFAFQQPPLLLACMWVRCYAVAPDGQGFYAVRMTPPAPVPPVTHIQLVQDWTEELKARVPAGPAR